MAREPGLADGGQGAAGRIDVHAHYVPAELQESLPDAPAFRGFAAWQPQAALEMMDRQGIATAILSMVLWTAIFAAADDAAEARRVVRSANDTAAEAIRTIPRKQPSFWDLPELLSCSSPCSSYCKSCGHSPWPTPMCNRPAGCGRGR